MPKTKREVLRRIMARPQSVLVPGVYDMISARLADQENFEVIYMTGYGVAASTLGLPDLGLATYTDMRQAVERLAEASAAPLIADADTGYGGLLNVRHTVRGYEAAGAAGLQLEDQEYPKRCGCMSGIRLVTADEMVRKLHIAIDSREDENFVIVARTDAYNSAGIDEALHRAEAYSATGADALFVEGIKRRSDLERIAANVDIPLVGIAPEDDDTAEIKAVDLIKCGFRLVIFPITPLLAAAAAMRAAYQAIKVAIDGRVAPPPLHSFRQFGALMGADELAAIADRYNSLPAIPERQRTIRRDM